MRKTTIFILVGFLVLTGFTRLNEEKTSVKNNETTEFFNFPTTADLQIQQINDMTVNVRENILPAVPNSYELFIWRDFFGTAWTLKFYYPSFNEAFAAKESKCSIYPGFEGWAIWFHWTPDPADFVLDATGPCFCHPWEEGDPQ